MILSNISFEKVTWLLVMIAVSISIHYTYQKKGVSVVLKDTNFAVLQCTSKSLSFIYTGEHVILATRMKNLSISTPNLRTPT